MPATKKVERQVTVRLPARWQGTLKNILERAARDFRDANKETPNVGDETRAAWDENAKQCWTLAAQLKRG